MSDEDRAELRNIAAALRGYLELHKGSGTVGFPRQPPGARVAAARPPQAEVEEPPASAAPAEPASAPAPPPREEFEPFVPPPLGERSAEARLGAKTRPMAQPKPQGDDGGPMFEPFVPPPEGRTLSREAADERLEAAPVVVVDPGPPVDRHQRLPVLTEEVASCTRCALAPTRTHTVFARGNPEARLCFVGEAPGADEDASGVPFVGRAGQLLDKMIVAMGLDPAKDVYVCNIIKCRPPDNRKPTPDEMAACMPYLQEQLRLVQPKVIVALGNSAVAGLLDTTLGITKMRGQWKLYQGKVLVMPTYHPSYLLRPSPQQAEAKRQAWDDLQAVMRELGIAPPKKKT